ncbi:MAG: thiamine diphosphokinase [Tidjanibacter sp.]|nr:thiamine diphosphokinase [Tidjanibacter sp.]
MKRIALPDISYKPTIVILANGEFPDNEIALSLLRGTEEIVCCDGAVRNLLETGLEPSVIIGDFDSIDAATAERYKDIMVHVDEQDTNDLCKAVEYCLAKGYKRLVVLGASGLREDHALANIGVMMKYAARCEIQMVTNFGVFDVVCGKAEFESWEGQQVSMFAFNPATKILVENLMYTPPEGSLCGLWQGVSNQSLGGSFVVDTSDMVVIFRVFEKKRAV